MNSVFRAPQRMLRSTSSLWDVGKRKGEIMGHRHKHTSRFKKTRARQRWKWHLKKMRRRSKYRRYVRKRAK